MAFRVQLCCRFDVCVVECGTTFAANTPENMKRKHSVLPACWIALALSAWNALGQTSVQPTPTPETAPDRTGRVVVSDQQAKTEGASVSALPDRLERQRLPTEIKDRLRRFELARDRYVKEEQELIKRLRGAATDDERERIRAQLDKQRQALLERAKTLREDVSKRLEDIRGRLRPMSEVLDDARQNARDAANPARKRRGQD